MLLVFCASIMKILNPGLFSGETKNSWDVNDIALTEVEYHSEKIDWHYHQNAFFSFIQRGTMSDMNKKGKCACGAGTVLFQQAGEPHCNPQLKNQPVALHIEVTPAWAHRMDIDLDQLPGFT